MVVHKYFVYNPPLLNKYVIIYWHADNYSNTAAIEFPYLSKKISFEKYEEYCHFNDILNMNEGKYFIEPKFDITIKLPVSCLYDKKQFIIEKLGDEYKNWHIYYKFNGDLTPVDRYISFKTEEYKMLYHLVG